MKAQRRVLAALSATFSQLGAKPLAMLDSLAFGDLNLPHTQHLVDRIVAGIGGYGNAIGIPTVGGETNFDHTYSPQSTGQCDVCRHYG